MSILISLIKKEAIHIVRDKRTLLVTIIMPLMLLLLFGFAISTEVNNIRIGVAADNYNDTSRDIIQRLSTNEYFSFEGMITEKEAEPLLRSGKIDAVLILRDNNGSIQSQIIVDACNPTFAQSAAAYISGIINKGAYGPIITRVLYNPQMQSAFNFVPGIMGMIFILICAIMTSVSIVREKESGSMNMLLISPVKPGYIIIGKLVPYFILSCIILAIMLTIAYTLLGLPMSATIVWVVPLSLLYIALSLSIGLLVSSIVSNQVSALIVSAVLFLTPVLMLSGMLFPIENMPAVLRGISCVIPARWYIAAMRKLMIQQLEFSYIVKETLILTAMTIVLLAVQIKKFNSRTS